MTAMTRLLLLLFQLLLVCTSTTLSVVKAETKNDNLLTQHALVDWIRQQGGVFHPKQEFRRQNPNDPSSPYGIFASETIEKDQVLASVPWKCVLTAGKDMFDTNLHCHTIQLLIAEMKKVQANNQESQFAPYIHYLLQRPPVDIPSTWSEEGKRLLDKMLQKGRLPPQDASGWLQDWHEECHGTNDPFDVQAAMLLLTRGDDDMMIPIYDLYNHRNGKWHNTRNNVQQDEKHEISAARRIEKGEQIYNSYNHCTNCYNRYTSYGTPEIFRDYGFVEQYPQRWIFSKQKIAFDVDVSEDGTTLKLHWLLDPPFDQKKFQVTPDALDFFQTHLHRLQQFNQTDLQPLLTNTADYQLPESELETAMQYYNALTKALELAIEAGNNYEFIHFDDDKDDDDDDDEVVVVSKSDNDVSLKQAVVEWVRQNGGYFNRKQEFRRENPNDPNSLYGIFARDKITKGETLLKVPWDLVMTAGTDDWETFHCDTARFIAREMKLGDKSFYAPYVEYLLASPPVDIPSTWSQKGQNLFLRITANGKVPPVSPFRWVDGWKEDCDAYDADAVDMQAAMQLLTRGDDDTLTPIYDMYNHRNGQYFNAQSYLTSNEKHEVTAFRNIEKGQQIYLSYNQCGNCQGRYYNFGTPEMLRDYGFVEAFPQRWIFHEQEIAFDLVETAEGTGELAVLFLDGQLDKEFDKLYEVTNSGINFLKSQLERLKTLEETVLRQLLADSSTDEAVPENELDTIMEYYHALTRALELAIEASKAYEYKVTREEEKDDDDDEDEDEEVVLTKRRESDYKWEENDDLDDDEDDGVDHWSDDVDCPGGMFVKGKCVTKIKKWEEL